MRCSRVCCTDGTDHPPPCTVATAPGSFPPTRWRTPRQSSPPSSGQEVGVEEKGGIQVLWVGDFARQDGGSQEAGFGAVGLLRRGTASLLCLRLELGRKVLHASGRGGRSEFMGGVPREGRRPTACKAIFFFASVSLSCPLPRSPLREHCFVSDGKEQYCIVQTPPFPILAQGWGIGAKEGTRGVESTLSRATQCWDLAPFSGTG